MKRIGLTVVVVFLTAFLTMFYYINNETVIVESDMNDPSYWFAEYLGYGSNITFKDGIAYLTVNDTDGVANNFWNYAKLQKGILPHGWARKDVIPEITFRKGFEAEKGYCFLKISAKRNEPILYYHSDPHDLRSIFNINIALIFKLDDKYDFPPDQSKQLVVDIRLSPFVREGDHTKIVYQDWHFQGEGYPDYEYYYQSNAETIMSEPYRWYEINADVGEMVKKAFDYWNIKQATLKCVLVYTEAYYGYGEANIDYVKIYVDPQPNSSFVISHSFLNGLIALLIMSIISLLKR